MCVYEEQTALVELWLGLCWGEHGENTGIWTDLQPWRQRLEETAKQWTGWTAGERAIR